MKKQEIEQKFSDIERKIDTPGLNLIAFPSFNANNFLFSEKRATNYLSEYVEWVYANVNAIADRVADIELKLFSVVANGDVKEIKQHPLLELLNRVNDFTTLRELIYNWVQHNYLTGESYWYLVKTGITTKPSEIWALRPDYMKVIPGDLANNEFIKRYDYTVPGKETISFRPDEIIFFKRPHPSNPYKGMSLIEAASTTLDTDRFSTLWNRNFFLNSARPDAVLMTDKNLDKNQIDYLKTQFKQKYSGTSNAHKLAVLTAGLTYQNIQQSVKEMDFLEQQKWTRDKLMCLFGNTKMALGIVEDVNRANAEMSEYIHAKHTIKPVMQMLTDALNEFLVPIYGKNLFLTFGDPVPESQSLLNDELDKLTNKVYTINESREKKGLPPVDGGDVLYLPISIMPLDGQTQAPVKTIEMQVKKKRLGKVLASRYKRYVQQVRNRDYTLKRLQKKLENKITKILIKQMQNHNTKSEILSEKSKNAFWHGFIEIVSKYESKFKEQIKAIYDNQKQEVIANLTNKKSVKKATTLFDADKWEVEAALNFMPLFEAILQDQGQSAMDYVGAELSYSTSESAKRFIEKNAIKLSHSFVSTELDRLKRVLQEGIDNGESVAELTNRVEGLFNKLTRSQAETIARTEIVKASNHGVMDAYRQTGFVTKKMWYTAEDEKVCEFCAPMDGKIVGIDQNYFDKGDQMTGLIGGKLDMDYEAIETPPLHANCRCTIVPILEAWKVDSNWNKKEFARKKRKDIRRKHKQDDIDRAVSKIKKEITK